MAENPISNPPSGIHAYVKQHWRFLLVCLLVVRGFFCILGYDRRPLFSSNDEAPLNDPALALARGQGLRAVSLEGLDLAQMWAHYPPAYFISQAVVFKTFGFSAGAVRLPGIVCSFAGIVIFGFILRGLHRARIIDEFGAIVAGVLVFVDPYILVISRVGRMEPLALLFGVAGIACVICARTPLDVSTRRWIAGGLMIGLGLSTHPTAILYWIALVAFAAIAPGPGIARRLATIVAVPGLLAAMFWVAVYRGQSWQALQQMYYISRISLVHPSLSIGDFFLSIWRRNLDGFSQAGGTMFVVLFAGWFAIMARAIICRDWKSAEGRRLLVFAAAGVLQMAFAWKFVIYSSRVILFAPLGGIDLAMALSFLPGTKRRLVTAFAGCFVAFQLLLGLIYFARLPRNWNAWSPDRFDAFVNALPAKRVASSYELWHAFMKAGREVRMIDFTLALERIYWREHPHRIEQYDAFILDEADYRSGIFDTAALPDATWIRSNFRADDKTYYVFRKK